MMKSRAMAIFFGIIFGLVMLFAVLAVAIVPARAQVSDSKLVMNEPFVFYGGVICRKPEPLMRSMELISDGQENLAIQIMEEAKRTPVVGGLLCYQVQRPLFGNATERIDTYPNVPNIGDVAILRVDFPAPDGVTMLSGFVVFLAHLIEPEKEGNIGAPINPLKRVGMAI